MNKEAPIGADSFCDERYCHIKIGTNWCLFIHCVRDTVILRSAPIGASSF